MWLLALVWCLGTVTAAALSPHEFKLLHQGTPTFVKRPSFPLTPGRPLRRPGQQLNFQTPRPPSAFPFFGGQSSHHGNQPTLMHIDLNLVKLRKLYSRLAQNTGLGSNPPPVPPQKRFTIKPDYIRDTFTSPHRPPDFTVGFPPVRAGRKHENTYDVYLGPNNRSIIFATRIQAVIGVDGDEDRREDGWMGPSPLPSIPLSNWKSHETRLKRYSVKKRVSEIFQPDTQENACLTLEGQMGECTTVLECHLVRGRPEPSTNCTFGTCCTHLLRGCDHTVRRNNTYWVSANAAGKARQEQGSGGSACSLKVEKLSRAICHLRLDLTEFRLKPPREGSCLEDRLLVEGQNVNSVVPQLCGDSSGEHIYVDVDNSTGPVEISLITVGNDFERIWNVRISQIECTSPTRPPRNCLQYLTETSGTLGSFNHRGQTGQYLNNLNYAICLRKGTGFCSIQYQVSSGSQFGFINEDNGVSTVPAGNAGVGAVDCPDDYINVGVNRLCGDRFNDGSDPAMSENTQIKGKKNTGPCNY